MSETASEPNAPWYSFTLPTAIETPRLVLRAWDASAGRLLKDAIDANLEHLQAWMPWAKEEPSPLEVIEERIALFAATFATGPHWGYMIFVRGETPMIGSVGLHARIGPGALEIGYWIDARHLRRGFATEAADAITRLGLSLPGVDRLEIRCDPANVASAGVPRKLGYRHVATIEKDTVTPTGAPRDSMVWELRADSER